MPASKNLHKSGQEGNQITGSCGGDAEMSVASSFSEPNYVERPGMKKKLRQLVASGSDD